MPDAPFSSGPLTVAPEPWLPSAITTLPRVRLANLPTPIVALPRLSQRLGGPAILMKRDDLTGLATGGNKTRKLEFLLADALSRGADCVITAGGPQSNHCRQTAAAAAQVGLSCHLVLGGVPPNLPTGNLLLDRLLGAAVHWTDKSRRNERMQELADELRSTGKQPYVIPIGGSNALGAIGYAAAMYELLHQLAAVDEQVDEIYVATSSGGTQAGLLLGAALAQFSGKVIGISIDLTPADEFGREIGRIAHASAQLLGGDATVGIGDPHLLYDFLGGGYGVVGDLERAAIQLIGRTEGILVGPVYTGRALGGLVERIRSGLIRADKRILFWHTGDESALHGYVSELQNSDS